ncbi:hypothetical protein N9849_00210 [bacterium]|nr:hypothetical protein [bacterium]
MVSSRVFTIWILEVSSGRGRVLGGDVGGDDAVKLSCDCWIEISVGKLAPRKSDFFVREAPLSEDVLNFLSEVVFYRLLVMVLEMGAHRATEAGNATMGKNNFSPFKERV